MRRRVFLALAAAAVAAAALGWIGLGQAQAENAHAAPISGVTIPQGYRAWQLVAPALEDAPFDELRAVLGNSIAIEAYRTGERPFPDGTILVKLAWRRVRSPQFESAAVPGAATTVHVMVKDTSRYASTGGWGFGGFVGVEPVDMVQHQACFACHEARASGSDDVFTQFAP